jgi:hypothetical protein
VDPLVADVELDVSDALAAVEDKGELLVLMDSAPPDCVEVVAPPPHPASSPRARTRRGAAEDVTT